MTPSDHACTLELAFIYALERGDLDLELVCVDALAGDLAAESIVLERVWDVELCDTDLQAFVRRDCRRRNPRVTEPVEPDWRRVPVTTPMLPPAPSAAMRAAGRERTQVLAVIGGGR